MAVTRKLTLEQWIGSQLFGDTDGRCTKMELRHIPIGQNEGQKVCGIRIPEKYERHFGDEVVAQLESMSEADASGISGVQVYVVQAFFGTVRKSSVGARYVFRQTGSEDPNQVNSEPPTLAGSLAQTQRHLEVVMRLNTVTQSASMTTLARENERLAQKCSELQEQAEESLRLREEMMSMQHERELNWAREERKDKAMEGALDKLGVLVPVIANKLTGKKMLPAADPRTLLIERFVGSLDQDQLQKMGSILRPEQAIAFATAAQGFLEGESHGETPPEDKSDPQEH